MSEIKRTKDYSIFKKNESNREIHQCNLKKLINSIRAQNMLEYRPIIVDRELRVIDGQHRLEAAKELGVEIYYQINREAKDEDMILLNTTQRKWVIDDYVNYYIHKGYPEYIKYEEYAKKKGTTAADLIRCLPRGGNLTRYIQKGQLKFFTADQLQLFEDQERKYKEFMIHIKKHVLSDKPFMDGLRFEKALKMLIKNEDVDWDLFVKKATIKSDAFKICATADAYYDLFLDIYNWKNHNKVFVGVKKTPPPKDEYDSPHQMAINELG